jgi:hypothetical protein
VDDRVPPRVPDLQVIAALSSPTMPSFHVSRSDASVSGDRARRSQYRAEVIDAEVQQESETATGFAETGQRQLASVALSLWGAESSTVRPSDLCVYPWRRSRRPRIDLSIKPPRSETSVEGGRPDQLAAGAYPARNTLLRAKLDKLDQMRIN